MQRSMCFALSLLGLGLAIVIAGCGGGGQITPHNVTVSVTPSTATVQAGGPAQFTATVTNDSANKGVTWTVACSAAPCGAVSPATTASGVATTYAAPTTPLSAALTVTITAASVADSSKTNFATITVLGTTVSVAPQSATVLAGATAPFTATVTSDPASKGVTWTVSCSPAPCGTVSPTATASGVATTYTAPATPPAGDLSVLITATSVANTAVSNSASITVPGTTVSVMPESATLLAGATQPFTATVTNDPASKGVTWTVSCSAALCGMVSPTATPSGVATTYTAPVTPPDSDLSVTITATSVFNTLVSNSAIVTVPAITVATTPHSALIPANVNQQFTATVGNDPANKGVTWTLAQGTTACSPACGSVAPSSTASGAPTTYTAPASVPSNPKVTLTATSASDSNKSDADTITVSSGSVKLVPLDLDFGSELTGRSSPAQTTILTNTGSSALTINSITITETNPGDFSLSPTNPCGTSVAAGSTCSISVIFKPTKTGPRSANVSISDSSTDSPQQISLSGIGRVLCGAQIKQTLSGSPVRSALATVGTAAAPVPTGPNSVGTRSMRLVDTSREDPFLENGTKRELMVRFWYPASRDQDCKLAEYTPPAVWSYFSQLMSLPLPAVTTNSCQDTPVTNGTHPVVVFSHGYTGTFTDYTFLFEDLASRGYVVASVDHTYEATAVQFPDGRFVHSGFGSHLGKTVLEDDASLSFALSVRLDDLKFVANELNRLNASVQSPFAGRIDTSRIAVAGHSMGGLAATLAVERDRRFKAGVIIDVHDGYVPEAVVGSTQTPVFILGSGREQWTENECKLWNNLHGPRFAVNFKGAEHLTPSDAVWLAEYAVKTGTMGPGKTVSALRNYIAAFLDATLRESALDPMLTGPYSDYPDAVVAAPGQALCGKGNDHSVTVHRAETD